MERGFIWSSAVLYKQTGVCCVIHSTVQHSRKTVSVEGFIGSSITILLSSEERRIVYRPFRLWCKFFVGEQLLVRLPRNGVRAMVAKCPKTGSPPDKWVGDPDQSAPCCCSTCHASSKQDDPGQSVSWFSNLEEKGPHLGRGPVWGQIYSNSCRSDLPVTQVLVI